MVDFNFGLGRGDGRWFSLSTGITRRLTPFGFFNALFSGNRDRSGSFARISSYFVVSISCIILCLVVWITGVDEEFVVDGEDDGDDDDILLLLLLLFGIDVGDDAFLWFTGELRDWNLSLIIVVVAGRGLRFA